jgi:Domain of unknown function (DUF4149)
LPNWLYLIFQFVYDVGLALWIGGALVLGAAAAPVFFKTLPRPQAGAIFGVILGRFARIQAIALLMIVIGAAARFLIWERHAATLWLVGRWGAIVFLACALLGQVSIQKKMRVIGSDLGPETEDNPVRLRFQQLHARAEGLMKASVIAAFVALFFS